MARCSRSRASVLLAVPGIGVPPYNLCRAPLLLTYAHLGSAGRLDLRGVAAFYSLPRAMDNAVADIGTEV